MSTATILDEISSLYDDGVRESTPAICQALDAFLGALEDGTVRAAARNDAGTWQVEHAVKKGILVAFRVGAIEEMTGTGPLPFADKNTLPPAHPEFARRGIRIVPGGSSVRRGAHLADRVTCMPPMYVNVGAFVGEGSLVDSHALVGSCAQVGKNVHISAAAQIGGVLEPIGLRPVIIEDDVLLGGGTGVYEGTLVREGAILGAGVTLTASTPVYDLVREEIIRADADRPLEIPAGAVVVPGSRPIGGSGFATKHGLHIYAPVIVKYRDDKTDLKAALEGDLR